MSSGRPELITKLVREIRREGALSFARFMEAALYDPEYGYYTAPGAPAPPIGWEGDFYTSSDLHPIFARAVARQIAQMDTVLGRPKPLTLVEMGSGTGSFLRDVLRALDEFDAPCTGRLRCVLIERSPALRAAQQRALEPFSACSARDPGRIRWAESLGALEPAEVEGVFFSNELLDAFPVHRVTMTGGKLMELYVDEEDGRLCERVGPLSTPRILDYLTRAGVSLQDGQQAEINLQALDWMRDVARALRRGFVITIDYGHTARDLYGPDRKQGTLLCYSRHRASTEPYDRVGLQDMTAHVDFTSLVLEGRDCGLDVTGFTNQMSFLAGLLTEGDLSDVPPDSEEFRSMIELLRPQGQGMGRTFKVLIQHKGLGRPELDGLRFKAFFDSALVPETTMVQAQAQEETDEQ